MASPHGKAQSAVAARRKSAFCICASRKSAFCTPTVTQSASFRESPPQSALFRRVRFSSPAQTWRRLTEKRILCRRPHGKAHSPTGASRKSAFCNPTVTQSASFRESPPQSALFRRMRLFSPGQTWRHLTEKRSLRLRHDGKAHSAYAPHGKAHSARQQSPRARLSVRVRPRVRFSVECAFPHLRKRGAASRKSAFSNRRLTEKRSLRPTPHEKHTLRSPDGQATSFRETAQPECTSDSP